MADPNEIELKWVDPDEEGLVKFLCGDRQFNEERIRAGAKWLLKSKSSGTQGRLDSFFKVLPSTTQGVKGKVEDDKKNTKKKSGFGKGGKRLK